MIGDMRHLHKALVRPDFRSQVGSARKTRTICALNMEIEEKKEVNFSALALLKIRKMNQQKIQRLINKIVKNNQTLRVLNLCEY